MALAHLLMNWGSTTARDVGISLGEIRWQHVWRECSPEDKRFNWFVLGSP